MEEKKKRSGAKRDFHGIEEKINHVSKSRTTKMIVDFCTEQSVSIKSFAIKGKQEVQATTSFLSGKMLMLAKLSLISFIYELLEKVFFQMKK